MSRQNSPKGKCKECDQDVLWVQMAKDDDGKQRWIPVEPEPMRTVIATPHERDAGRLVGEFVVSHRVHFATCRKNR